MPVITLHRQVRLDNSCWIGSLQKWPTIPGVLGGRSGTGCQAAYVTQSTQAMVPPHPISGRKCHGWSAEEVESFKIIGAGGQEGYLGKLADLRKWTLGR